MSGGPEFESVDLAGSTVAYSGTVTTAIAIPGVADKVISEFFLENTSSGSSDILEVSLDAGVSYHKIITRNGHWSWTIKGFIQQIYIRSLNGGGVNYTAVINYEDY